MDVEIIENGVAEFAVVPTLPPGALRRLSRLQARVDGATDVAQAAINAHTAARGVYQQAFLAACEDAGITVPDGEHEVDIDWRNGAVRFTPKRVG